VLELYAVAGQIDKDAITKDELNILKMDSVEEEKAYRAW
jgi:hypothetical protein